MAEVLIGTIGTILGTILGSILTVALSRFATRHTLTVDLMKYLVSAEHYYVLQVIWNLRDAWQQDDGRLLVNHFIQSPNLVLPAENSHANNLTDHQHLDIYLRFLSQIVYYYEKNIIDRKLFEIILTDHYSWYSDFINDFVMLFEKRRIEVRDVSPLPSWVSATKKLSVMLSRRSTQNGRHMISSIQESRKRIRYVTPLKLLQDLKKIRLRY